MDRVNGGLTHTGAVVFGLFGSMEGNGEELLHLKGGIGVRLILPPQDAS